MKTSEFIRQTRAMADALENALNTSTNKLEWIDKFYAARAEFGMVEELAGLTRG